MESPANEVRGSKSVSIFTKLYTLGMALLTIPPAILIVTLSHAFQPDQLLLGERIKRAVFRNVLNIIPISLLRQENVSRINKVLESPRFSAVRNQLLAPVKRPDFSGYWICRNSITRSESPKKSDVTILYCHGGGYVSGNLSLYLTLLLRLAESVEEKGATVSIFMLDYSLAPEFPFPTQLEQITAAYKFITENEGVSPGKIALVGDSAGGNLILSFLTSLSSPLFHSSPKLSTQFLGLFLVSPWVSLLHSASSFQTNASLDILSKSSLDYWASCFQIGSKLDQEVIRFYTEFGNEDKGRPSLETILPNRVWISAGGDELMVSDITSFAEHARNDGIQVSLSIAPGKTHDWQLSETQAGEDAYLKIPQSDFASSHLPGIVTIGRMIAECIKHE